MSAATLPTERVENLKSAQLDRSVKIEPLIDRWYAWPHLFAPVQQALNLACRYLPLLKSFVLAPDVHLSAARDPKMFGGPFVDLPKSSIHEVEKYISFTEVHRKEALELVRSYLSLDKDLRTMNGISLDEVRRNLCPSLRGRVELVYDLNNHPKIRILEEMFDEDDLGHRDSQEILLHRMPDIERKFFLSTPRIGENDGLILKSSFDSEAIRAICNARCEPIDLIEAARSMRCAVDSLEPFFTNPKEARWSPPYAGNGVRIRYFGHATLLIESRNTSILIDPSITTDKLTNSSHLTLDDLPRKIDFLLISHGHQDHFVPELLLQLMPRIGTVLIPPHNHGEPSDPSLKRILRSLGYHKIQVMSPLETIAIPNGSITSLPFSGEHCDLDVHSKQCASIEIMGRKVCIFVDSDAIDVDIYRRLRNKLSQPDAMFIGMECFGAPLSWLYGPIISQPITRRVDNSRRLSGANHQRAWALTEELKPRRTFVYAMGQEPWMRYLMGLSYTEDSIQIKECRKYIQQCRESGIPAENLFMQKDIEL